MKHQYSIAHCDILLVPLSVDYSEKYRLLRNRPDVGKWFTYKGVISKEEQLQWYNHYLESQDDIMFAILDKAGNFIGGNSIYRIDQSKHAEYGRLIIDPMYSGNNYGYQATCAAILIAKDILNLNCLNLEVYSDNIAAYKSYQKAGFVKNGSIIDSHGCQMTTMSINLKDY